MQHITGPETGKKRKFMTKIDTSTKSYVIQVRTFHLLTYISSCAVSFKFFGPHPWKKFKYIFIKPNKLHKLILILLCEMYSGIFYFMLLFLIKKTASCSSLR